MLSSVMGQIFQLKDRLLKQIHCLDVYRNYKLWAQTENMLAKSFQYIMKMHLLFQNQLMLLRGDLVGIFICIEHSLLSFNEDFSL